MSIYFREGMAFVDVGYGKTKCMLCIGTRADVEKADEQQLMDMIAMAHAISRFRSLRATMTLH